jgi:small subunit ribosomal protein S4
VNGIIVNIPSYALRPGDVITLRPKSKDLVAVQDAIANANRKKYNWLDMDRKLLTGKFLNAPEVEEIPENINVQLIVELYSK